MVAASSVVNSSGQRHRSTSDQVSEMVDGSRHCWSRERESRGLKYVVKNTRAQDDRPAFVMVAERVDHQVQEDEFNDETFKNQRRAQGLQRFHGLCWCCGQRGHQAAQCWNWSQSGVSEDRLQGCLRRLNGKLTDKIETMGKDIKHVENEINMIEEGIKMRIEDAINEHMFKNLEQDKLMMMLDGRFKQVYSRIDAVIGQPQIINTVINLENEFKNEEEFDIFKSDSFNNHDREVCQDFQVCPEADQAVQGAEDCHHQEAHIRDVCHQEINLCWDENDSECSGVNQPNSMGDGIQESLHQGRHIHGAADGQSLQRVNGPEFVGQEEHPDGVRRHQGDCQVAMGNQCGQPEDGQGAQRDCQEIRHDEDFLQEDCQDLHNDDCQGVVQDDGQGVDDCQEFVCHQEQHAQVGHQAVRSQFAHQGERFGHEEDCQGWDVENLVALEWTRGSALEKHFKTYVNEGKSENVKIAKECLRMQYGSSIFDRLIKESDVTTKQWDLHIRNIDDFKEEFRCFKNVIEFKEESEFLRHDTFDRFIKELQQYVNEDIKDFEQNGTSSTGSGSSSSSSLRSAST